MTIKQLGYARFAIAYYKHYKYITFCKLNIGIISIYISALAVKQVQRIRNTRVESTHRKRDKFVVYKLIEYSTHDQLHLIA